jgi:hypothetical protein
MPCRALRAGAAIVAALAAPSAFAADLTLTLDNQASAAVKEFYASPVDLAGWDLNLLGPDALPPGLSRQVAVRAGGDVCTFDLRVVFADGEAIEEPAVDLCTSPDYTISDPPADD